MCSFQYSGVFVACLIVFVFFCLFAAFVFLSGFVWFYLFLIFVATFSYVPSEQPVVQSSAQPECPEVNLLPGFCQVFTRIHRGKDKFQKRKPIRNLLGIQLHPGR